MPTQNKVVRQPIGGKRTVIVGSTRARPDPLAGMTPFERAVIERLDAIQRELRNIRDDGANRVGAVL